MSLRAKLATTIAALCMVICLLTVGVWAAGTATVNIGGTVSFNAEDVYATVTASFAGTKATIEDKSVTFNAETANSTENWTNLDLEFADKATDIVITVTVTNLSTERKLGVALTDTSTTTNYTVAITDSASAELDASGEATFTITLHIADANKAVSGSFAVAVALTNVSEEA